MAWPSDVSTVGVAAGWQVVAAQSMLRKEEEWEMGDGWAATTAPLLQLGELPERMQSVHTVRAESLILISTS